jgi:hypothetical protein
MTRTPDTAPSTDLIAEVEALVALDMLLKPDAARAVLTALRAAEAREQKLREALTPSAETKHAYIGEFKFKSASDRVTHTVPWPTIKEIMAAIALRALGGEP